MDSATPDGNLLVYDATGQHLYALATVVPEASTFALALPALAMVGAVVLRKRRKSA